MPAYAHNYCAIWLLLPVFVSFCQRNPNDEWEWTQVRNVFEAFHLILNVNIKFKYLIYVHMFNTIPHFQIFRYKWGSRKMCQINFGTLRIPWHIPVCLWAYLYCTQRNMASCTSFRPPLVELHRFFCICSIFWTSQGFLVMTHSCFSRWVILIITTVIIHLFLFVVFYI